MLLENIINIAKKWDRRALKIEENNKKKMRLLFLLLRIVEVVDLVVDGRFHE